MPPGGKGTPPGYSTLVFTSVGHFLNDGYVFLFPIIADIFATGQGYTPLMLTGMFGVFYGTSTLFGFLASSKAERGRRIGGLNVGIFLISVGLVLFGAAVIYGKFPYIAVIASSFVMGMGAGFYHPIGAGILQKAYSGSIRGKVLGVNGATGAAGRAVFSFVFLGLAVLASQGKMLLYLALVGFAGSGIIWFGLRNTSYGDSSKRKHERVNDVINLSIILLTSMVLMRAIAAQGMVAWIPTFFSYSKGYSINAHFGILLATMYLPAVVSQPIIGLLVDRIDRRVLLSATTLGTSLAMLAYMNTSGPLELAILALFGFVTFSGFPITMSLASDYAPRGSSSLTNSVVWGLGSSGGQVMGPIIAGAIILQNYSRISLSFDVLITLGIVAAAVALVLPSSGKKKSGT